MGHGAEPLAVGLERLDDRPRQLHDADSARGFWGLESDLALGGLDHRPFDAQRRLRKIHVAPAQREGLTDAEARTEQHPHERLHQGRARRRPAHARHFLLVEHAAARPAVGPHGHLDVVESPGRT